MTSCPQLTHTSGASYHGLIHKLSTRLNVACVVYSSGTLARMTTHSDSPRWLTVKDVADELGVATMTVYRIVNSGELPALRLSPRSIRISREHLEAYIDRQTSHAAPEPPTEAEDEDLRRREVEAFLFDQDAPDPLLLKQANHLGRVLRARGQQAPPSWEIYEALVATSSEIEHAALKHGTERAK